MQNVSGHCQISLSVNGQSWVEHSQGFCGQTPRHGLRPWQIKSSEVSQLICFIGRFGRTLCAFPQPETHQSSKNYPQERKFHFLFVK